MSELRETMTPPLVKFGGSIDLKLKLKNISQSGTGPFWGDLVDQFKEKELTPDGFVLGWTAVVHNNEGKYPSLQLTSLDRHFSLALSALTDNQEFVAEAEKEMDKIRQQTKNEHSQI